jgi:DNA-binding Xre family transcriptional regulator
MNFLINLDYLLTINKMTRSELARKIEIAPSTINAWYTKDYKGITLKNLVKLSKCFDVTIEDLVNGDIKSLSFTSDNYSDSELKAIKDFSEYLKRSRANE